MADVFSAGVALMAAVAGVGLAYVALEVVRFILRRSIGTSNLDAPQAVTAVYVKGAQRHAGRQVWS